MPFTLTRVPLEPRRRRITVRAVEDLGPHYRRVTFEGADLLGFDSPGADDHIRIFLPPPGGRLPASLEGIELASREFTPAAFDGERLAIDFVLHGGGAASDWAERAGPGDEVLVGGPRGSMRIEGRPDWWLLAGDLTALPAIRRFLGDVPAEAAVDVIVLAEDPADERALGPVGGRRVAWVRSLDGLVAALDEAPARAGEGFAFIAAEQGVVKPARAWLERRGVGPDHAVVKGYWREGLTADAPKAPQ